MPPHTLSRRTLLLAAVALAAPTALASMREVMRERPTTRRKKSD